MSSIERLTELKQEMKKVAQDAFNEGIKLFFETYPNVEEIRWDQYAPYYNDGEACVFSVRTLHIKRKDRKKSDLDEEFLGDYEDGFENVYDLEDNDPLQTGMKELQKIMKETEDHLKNKFGEDCTVTVQPDGHTKLEVCSHE